MPRMTEEQRAEWRRNHAAEMEQRRLASVAKKAAERARRKADQARITEMRSQIWTRIVACGGSRGKAGIFWPVSWYGLEVVITPSLRRGPEAVPVCGVLVTSDRYAVTLECEGERREVKLVTGDLMTLARRESLVG